jgi:hypothetical protein
MQIDDNVCLDENERTLYDSFPLIINGQKARISYGYGGSLQLELYKPYSSRTYSRSGLPKVLDAVKELL